MPTNGVCILLKKDMVLDLKFDIKDGKDMGTASGLIQTHDMGKRVKKIPTKNSELSNTFYHNLHLLLKKKQTHSLKDIRIMLDT